MAKIIDLGLLKADHPMFSGGVETFSIRKSKPSTKSSAPSTDGDKSKPSAGQMTSQPKK